MGSTYRFRCPSCGYSACVSGGDDAGFMCATTTIVCEDCKKLYDIVISKEPWKIKPVWSPKAIHCPESKSHKAKKWEHPGKCPRCGEMLTRDEGASIMWD